MSLPEGTTEARPILRQTHKESDMIDKIAIKGAVAALVAVVIGSPAGADSLTLKQAIETALKSNPSIAAQQLSADAAGQAARGARALKNPEMILAPSLVGTAGADSAALISQPLELNGSRKARAQVAGQEAAIAKADAQIISRNIILNVKQLYWGTAQAQHIVKLNEQNVSYLETLGEAVRRQVDVGRIPGSQIIKTDVELSRAKQELAQAALDYETSKASLNTLLNRPPRADVTLVDELAFVSFKPDADKMISDGLANRPEIGSASAELGAAQGRIDAARAELRPDAAVEARKESFDSGDSGIAVSFNLPIFDWGSRKAAVKQAQTLAASQQQQMEATRNAIKLDVEQALLAERTTAELVEYYQGGILDKSEQLATLAQKGFEKGATSYLEVLEAQRTLRTIRSDYISAIAAHSKAVAQLEWAANVEMTPDAAPQKASAIEVKR